MVIIAVGLRETDFALPAHHNMVKYVKEKSEKLTLYFSNVLITCTCVHCVYKISNLRLTLVVFVSSKVEIF